MTIWFPWPALDWKVSGDGLLTFFGGLLAFFAVLFQVWSTNKDLQRQLDSETQARVDSSNEENFALARALLMELDHFYVGYIRDTLEEFKSLPAGQLKPMRRMPPDPFLMYRSCGARIGFLPPALLATIVRAYSQAQWLVDRVNDYRDVFFQVGDPGIADPTTKLARASLKELPDVYEGTEKLLNRAAEMLCEFLGVPLDTSSTALSKLKLSDQGFSEGGKGLVPKDNA